MVWSTLVVILTLLCAVVDSKHKSKLKNNDWKELRHKLHGDLVESHSEEYSSSFGLFYATYDNVLPKAIIYCVNEADVITAIEFVAKHKSALDEMGGFRVRSCGHSLAGGSTTTGVVIDVSRLNQLSFAGDRTANGGTLNVEPGVELAAFARFASKNDIVSLPLSPCGGCCFGGYLLAGGLGVTSRTLGLAVDWLRSARVALANGDVVVATQHNTHKDLFWALKGAGQQNFGIVTQFQVEIPTLQFSSSDFQFENGRALLRRRLQGVLPLSAAKSQLVLSGSSEQHRRRLKKRNHKHRSELKEEVTFDSENAVGGSVSRGSAQSGERSLRSSMGLFIHLKWAYSKQTFFEVRTEWQRLVTDKTHGDAFNVYLMLTPSNGEMSRKLNVEMYGFWTNSAELSTGYALVGELLSAVSAEPSFTQVEAKQPFDGWLESKTAMSATELKMAEKKKGDGFKDWRKLGAFVSEGRLDYSVHCTSRFGMEATLGDEVFEQGFESMAERVLFYDTRSEDEVRVESGVEDVTADGSGDAHRSKDASIEGIVRRRLKHTTKKKKKKKNEAERSEEVEEAMQRLAEGDTVAEVMQQISDEKVLDKVVDYQWLEYAYPSLHMYLAPAGARISQVAADQSAFPWRNAQYLWVGCVRYMSEFQGVFDFANDVIHELNHVMDKEFGHASFIAFADPLLKQNIHQRVYGNNHNRLRRLKAKYDSAQLFQSSLGIVRLGIDAELVKERHTFEADNPKLYLSDSAEKMEEKLEEERGDVRNYDEGVVKTGEGVENEEVLSKREAHKEEMREERMDEMKKVRKREERQKKGKSERGMASRVILVLVLIGVAIGALYLGRGYIIEWCELGADDFGAAIASGKHSYSTLVADDNDEL